MPDNAGWSGFVGQVVVIDTNSQYVYLGTLKEVLDNFVLLEDVDVHDRGETTTTKEQYIMDTKKFGVKANRKEASVRMSLIVSLSKLDDIVIY